MSPSTATTLFTPEPPANRGLRDVCNADLKKIRKIKRRLRKTIYEIERAKHSLKYYKIEKQLLTYEYNSLCLSPAHDEAGLGIYLPGDETPRQEKEVVFEALH